MRLPSKAKNNLFFFAAVFSILFAIPLYAQTTVTVNLEPLEKWIEKHRDLHSLYVEFEQERKLRTLRKPITTTGKIWMAETGKFFRMQTGEPARSIILKDGKGNTTVINTKKRTAEIIGPDKKFGGRANKMEEMFQHLFPRSMADLQANFCIVSVVKDGENWKAILEPKQADTAKFLKQFILRISKEADTLLGFSLHLRDNSIVTSRTTKSMRNPKVPSEVFSPSLSGYKIKK